MWQGSGCLSRPLLQVSLTSMFSIWIAIAGSGQAVITGQLYHRKHLHPCLPSRCCGWQPEGVLPAYHSYPYQQGSEEGAWWSLVGMLAPLSLVQCP